MLFQTMAISFNFAGIYKLFFNPAQTFSPVFLRQPIFDLIAALTDKP